MSQAVSGMSASRSKHQGGIEGGISQQSSNQLLSSWPLGISRRMLLGMLGWGLGWGVSHQPMEAMCISKNLTRHDTKPPVCMRGPSASGASISMLASMIP